MIQLRPTVVALACVAFWASPSPLQAAQAPAQAAGGAPSIPPDGPSIPIVKSPVATFRELLAMNSADRQVFLEARPPEVQRQLLRKVREYAALDPNQREWRLQATELRWYLVPLMSSPATNRTAQLKQIPASIRPLVSKRLRAWDSLPLQTRKDFLDNEAAVQYFTAAEGQPPLPPGLTKTAPGADRLEATVTRWRALPPDERTKMQQRFNLFFELSHGERERAIRTLSEEEQGQIEKSLDLFSSLPPAQRRECIRAFDSFSGMSSEDRKQFLRNAQRWSQMSPAERNAWRDLVSKLSQQPPPPPSPTERPPTPEASASAPAVVATNH